MAALGLAGWLLALGSLGAAAALRIQLRRHLMAAARACHELRGPLTAVRLGLELDARTAHPCPKRVRAIELELGRAILAVDDLSRLRTSRGRRREPPSCAELIDLGELVGDSVEAWSAWSASRGVRLELGRVGAAMVVAGERLRLAQAVGNLIANGVEHGEDVVTVSLRAEPGLVRVEVVDDGPGLPAPVEELLHRSRRPAVRSDRGHGLAIVDGVASAHGGRLAGAPSDRGARLVLELPAASEDARPRDLDVLARL